MVDRLKGYAGKPSLYAPSTGKFWDDEYISKKMLEFHLDPHAEAATRSHAFVDRSAAWISGIVPPSQYPLLLDLGCGPGLYAERFHRAGYSVTGWDFSQRSIAYAQEQARRGQSGITYHHRDYLTLDYREQFNVVTLIYCDYAVLSAANRLELLKRVYRALKPGGKFILDVPMPRMRKPESRSPYYAEKDGFFTGKPHLCLEAVHQYEDEDRTELRQYIIVTDEEVHSYHIWDHFFTREALMAEARPAGFGGFAFYGDVAGRPFSQEGETLCAVLEKR